jgi:hypothetical protein
MNNKKTINRIAVVLSIIALVWGVKFGVDDHISSESGTHTVFTKVFQDYIFQNYNVFIDRTIKEEGDPAPSDVEIRSVLSKKQELSKHFFDGISPTEKNPLTRYRSEHEESVYEIEKVSPPMINTLSLGAAFGITMGSITFIGIQALYFIVCLIIPGLKKGAK